MAKVQSDLRQLNRTHWLKTCPRCSKEAGFLVWLPYPEAFGKSAKRPASGAQSHCTRCRSDLKPGRQGDEDAGRARERKKAKPTQKGATR